MHKFVWPSLIVLGVLFVLLFDQGRGLASPGFWLIPIGVIGTLFSKRNTPSVNQPRNKWLVGSLIGAWLLAFYSIAGLWFHWFTEGFDMFLWAPPALIFTVVGLVLSVIYVLRR